MDIQKDTQDVLRGNSSFWISERIIFIASVMTFLFFALLLVFTEQTNTRLTYKSFLDYFFDTVSVGTLTGLFRGDSGTFTFSGQVILLADMVINGLITSFISILLVIFIRLRLDRKQSLRQELKKINGDSRKILQFIFLDFLFIWGAGTVLFLFSGTKGVWEAVFNAASHILNDGVTASQGNMIPFRENAQMLLFGALLITVGGLGISIRGYFYKVMLRKIGCKRLAARIPDAILAPKNFLILILIVTLFLQIFGAGTMYYFEHTTPHLFAANATEGTKLLNTYYISVSARTAGFTTMPDLSLLHDKSSYLLMVLMTIGASSGSFAGGVFKLTAFIYLFVYIISRIRGDPEIETPHRHVHLSQRTVIEANFRVIGFTIILGSVIFLLFLFEPHMSALLLTFESISAVTNTGLTLGATELLDGIGMFLVILLMIVGKLGFITTVISFFPKYQRLIEHAKTDFDEFPVD